jgi:hypothetical protein
MTSSPFKNPLPGVPHIESPFFDALFADADDATRALAVQLRMQGYVVIDFPDPDIHAMAEAIKTNLVSHWPSDAFEQFRKGQGSALRLQDAWTFDDNVKRIACNDAVLELLGKLYGVPAWPFQTLNFPVGTEQHFHTDAVHFSSTPERFMCGVWVALEDITLDNGPLQYYPGSHSWPLFTNEHIGCCVSKFDQKPTQAIYHELWQALVDAKRVAPEKFLAKKGQALIWAANLLHGGCAHLNKSLSRWSQVTHYFFENCAYYTPMNSDPFYGTIDFRELVNIKTGKVMPQRYAGQTIPESFVAGLGMCFEASSYLAANPDVAKAGVDPFEHYLRHGQKEKRPLRPA